ncbi:MAG: roadblock/LC7 domain-containing protein [Promethearchaeota archaeon]
MEILKDYLEFKPSFKTEINQKIAELEARVNTVTSKTNKTYKDLEEELEMLQYIEPSDNQSLKSPYFLSREMFQSSVLENLDKLLGKFINTIPEVKAATVVSTEGEIIASALPQDVDEATIAVMTAALLSLAESAITMIKSGEFEYLFIKGRDGYLLVLQAGQNAVLAISTSKDVRLGLIFLDCKRTAEQIAKLI